MKENFSRTILISGTFLSYEFVKSKRAKRTNLTMYPDGKLKVTVPRFATHLAAERLIKYKRDWIVKNLAKVLKRDIKVLPKIKTKELSLYKNKAREILEEKVEKFNKHYNFAFKKIFVKNHKSQWGSCSTYGNLNFNYKLLFLPDHLIDYIVVHELCHLKEHNHSRDFWNLVSETVGDYKKINKELGDYMIG